ncbi:hypothetical protein Hypma_009552 [Hypsizygus marmoreus]|uniref:DUF6699 domain-containing protein n=1 Tax=Hypsizygus marmoreus TaxID=39966 RepID=A0A369JP60_HYPMA|nr:hypothetical protein Hypma_009552 [Hypsizygus marmoreus]
MQRRVHFLSHFEKPSRAMSPSHRRAQPKRGHLRQNPQASLGATGTNPAEPQASPVHPGETFRVDQSTEVKDKRLSWYSEAFKGAPSTRTPVGSQFLKSHTAQAKRANNNLPHPSSSRMATPNSEHPPIPVTRPGQPMPQGYPIVSALSRPTLGDSIPRYVEGSRGLPTDAEVSQARSLLKVPEPTLLPGPVFNVSNAGYTPNFAEVNRLPTDSASTWTKPIPNASEPASWVPNGDSSCHFCGNAPLQIHPYLSDNKLYWNLIYRPRYAACYGLSLPAYQEPAIYPNARKITIMPEMPGMAPWMERWGPLTVKPDNDQLTLKNVMDAIYAYFQTPLTSTDVSCLSQRGNEKVTVSRVRRLDSLHRMAYPLEESKRCLLRVDILNGNWRFVRLKLSSFSGNHAKVALQLAGTVFESP